MKSVIKIGIAVLLIGGFAFVVHSSNHDTQMADPGGGVRPTG
jgi:hypothetical protein